MPFVGQPNPLGDMPLGKTSNKSFTRRMEMMSFKPRNSPKTHWIAFIQELHNYLDGYLNENNAISGMQLKLLLRDHLGDFDRFDSVPPTNC